MHMCWGLCSGEKGRAFYSWVDRVAYQQEVFNKVRHRQTLNITHNQTLTQNPSMSQH